MLVSRSAQCHWLWMNSSTAVRHCCSDRQVYSHHRRSPENCGADRPRSRCRERAWATDQPSSRATVDLWSDQILLQLWRIRYHVVLPIASRRRQLLALLLRFVEIVASIGLEDLVGKITCILTRDVRDDTWPQESCCFTLSSGTVLSQCDSN